MDMHAMRNAVEAQATPQVFRDESVEKLASFYGTRYGGGEWIHPVSGDELAKLKAGVSRSQQLNEVDPMA